jgi:hypothetical protein
MAKRNRSNAEPLDSRGRKIGNRRRRRTVSTATPVPTNPPTAFGPSFSLDDITKLFQTFHASLPAPAPAPALIPVSDRREAGAAVAPPVTPTVRPRIFYAANPTPTIPGGEAGQKLYTWLLDNPGQQSQLDMEKGTHLTEGQVKGAIRTLYLAGWVTKHGNGPEGA